MATRTKPELDPYDRDTVQYLRALQDSTVAPGSALVDRVRRMAEEIATLKQAAEAKADADREVIVQAILKAANSEQLIGGALWVDGTVNDFADAILALLSGKSDG